MPCPQRPPSWVKAMPGVSTKSRPPKNCFWLDCFVTNLLILKYLGFHSIKTIKLYVHCSSTFCKEAFVKIIFPSAIFEKQSINSTLTYAFKPTPT